MRQAAFGSSSEMPLSHIWECIIINLDNASTTTFCFPEITYMLNHKVK